VACSAIHADTACGRYKIFYRLVVRKFALGWQFPIPHGRASGNIFHASLTIDILIQCIKFSFSFILRIESGYGHSGAAGNGTDNIYQGIKETTHEDHRPDGQTIRG
jgi:hypothetical protein